MISTSSRQSETFIDIVILGHSIPLELIIGVATLGALVYVALALKASRQSNVLQTLPTLVVKPTSNAKDATFKIMNLTNKLAYSIEIDPIYLFHKYEGIMYKVTLMLPEHNYLDAKEQRELKEFLLADGAVDRSKTLSSVIAQVKEVTENLPMVVRFKDSQGIKYFTELTFAKGSEQIARSPRKLTLMWRGRLFYRKKRRHYRLRKNVLLRARRIHPDIIDQKK